MYIFNSYLTKCKCKSENQLFCALKLDSVQIMSVQIRDVMWLFSCVQSTWGRAAETGQTTSSMVFSKGRCQLCVSAASVQPFFSSVKSYFWKIIVILRSTSVFLSNIDPLASAVTALCECDPDQWLMRSNQVDWAVWKDECEHGLTMHYFEQCAYKEAETFLS